MQLCLTMCDEHLGRVTMSSTPLIKQGRYSGIEVLVFAAFFLSGLAALIYQVSWQRLLYGEFGVDLESITIIVSCFMLGLGAGSLLGGWAADRFAGANLRVFGFVELCIGLFGLASPNLIKWVSESFSHGGAVMLAASSFTVLLVPTVLRKV